MADNIRVCARFRPVNARERAAGPIERTISVEDGSVVHVQDPQGRQKHKFVFDAVLEEDSTQYEAFDRIAGPLVEGIFSGYNSTVFAYGQTGSGKTFTMMGVEDDIPDREQSMAGIIPRMVDAIFDGIADSPPNMEFVVKVSYVEIYNERIRDLLTPDKDNLRVREDPKHGVWIQDVTQVVCQSYESVMVAMRNGVNNRAVSATLMNAESSRSHSVFILSLGQLNTETGSKRGSKLFLVDLAGSEKVQKTGAAGDTLKEAQHINKSLSALGNVINALTSSTGRNKKHIPYRDSKLTRLLSDSLGGNSRTCLIVTASPHPFNLEETISTMRFGVRAKSIKNRAKVNQELSVTEYKRLLQQAERKIAVQHSVIEALEFDVQQLQLCLEGVPESALAAPIPILTSPEVKKKVAGGKGLTSSSPSSGAAAAAAVGKKLEFQTPTGKKKRDEQKTMSAATAASTEEEGSEAAAEAEQKKKKGKEETTETEATASTEEESKKTVEDDMKSSPEERKQQQEQEQEQETTDTTTMMMNGIKPNLSLEISHSSSSSSSSSPSSAAPPVLESPTRLTDAFGVPIMGRRRRAVSTAGDILRRSQSQQESVLVRVAELELQLSDSQQELEHYKTLLRDKEAELEEQFTELREQELELREIKAALAERELEEEQERILAEATAAANFALTTSSSPSSSSSSSSVRENGQEMMLSSSSTEEEGMMSTTPSLMEVLGEEEEEEEEGKDEVETAGEGKIQENGRQKKKKKMDTATAADEGSIIIPTDPEIETENEKPEATTEDGEEEDISDAAAIPAETGIGKETGQEETETTKEKEKAEEEEEREKEKEKEDEERIRQAELVLAEKDTELRAEREKTAALQSELTRLSALHATDKHRLEDELARRISELEATKRMLSEFQSTEEEEEEEGEGQKTIRRPTESVAGGRKEEEEEEDEIAQARADREARLARRRQREEWKKQYSAIRMKQQQQGMDGGRGAGGGVGGRTVGLPSQDSPFLDFPTTDGENGVSGEKRRAERKIPKNRPVADWDPSEMSPTEALTRSLKAKCDQYIQLTILHANTKDRLAQVESELEQERQQARDLQTKPGKVVRRLEDELRVARAALNKLHKSVLGSQQKQRQLQQVIQRQEQQLREQQSKLLSLEGSGGGGRGGGDGEGRRGRHERGGSILSGGIRGGLQHVRRNSRAHAGSSSAEAAAAEAAAAGGGGGGRIQGGGRKQKFRSHPPPKPTSWFDSLFN